MRHDVTWWTLPPRKLGLDKSEDSYKHPEPFRNSNILEIMSTTKSYVLYVGFYEQKTLGICQQVMLAFSELNLNAFSFSVYFRECGITVWQRQSLVCETTAGIYSVYLNYSNNWPSNKLLLQCIELNATELKWGCAPEKYCFHYWIDGVM